MDAERNVEIERVRRCHVSSARCQAARKANKKRDRTEQKNPHGGLEAKLVGEEANKEREEFCQRCSDGTQRHEAGTLTGQA